MPMTPGLKPNLRQLFPSAEELAPADDDFGVVIEEGGPEIEQDDNGEILRIEHPDGSVTISLNGKGLGDKDDTAGRAQEWFRNLVDEIDEGELVRISDELMRGIKDDLTSRQDWIQDRAQGIKLLGLKVEIPGLQGATDGAPVEGMSKVRHPLLLEAVLRFQANARSEMLPTDGPVKVRNDANASTIQQDTFANALEKDLNHYLTAVASEYYPDTDRMLLMLGFGGTSFKKIYFCPLRNRPVSESVDADDLIVNNSATDLRNAKRITHKVMMRPSTVKRLQILGVYKDVELSTPKPAELDEVQRIKNDQQGIAQESFNPEDRDREIYECYCELDVGGFEHKYKGKISGLEIPYRVTIDVSTKEILSIVRNYDEEDKELPTARINFTKYTFVPGMGFYDIGLLHILGNTTNAVTAAWRELLDSGMYANFPGFLMADTGARQNTNIFRIPPGGGALVKTGGLPINQAIMPLPYNTGAAPSLMGLVDNMVQTGSRVGGTAELAVGEGRQDAPVGTTLAMIEQATKILNAVHKRMHAAQAEEFQLLRRCFKEHPESFWQQKGKLAYPWDEQTFIQALNDCELVPQADPNTASHTQRLMKIMALKQLQSSNPGMFDPIVVDTEALKAIGWSNPEQFFAPQDAQANPPPELLAQQSKMMSEQKKADASMMDAQTRSTSTQMKGEADMIKAQVEMMKAQADMKFAEAELHQKAEDRASRERIQLIDLAQNVAVHPYSAGLINPLIEPAMRNIAEEEQQNMGGIMPPNMPGV